ncbi:class I SAM-dependent RNA methyltransferase [Corynebacterium glyciniphilum]|uniref:class I SAM-dependent RNA methyltransferase n=1 Tax=Corynebacterium glyciniphilum TaxID=1404244 RepID=UPI00264C004F|nr:TRAM domain-containing protein [Corynebacterium glyciniphilum]MDN5684633.1 TRAM domain-containing protein [Corynebacterium glyciniphilum]MDN6705622.1 TRAM domain-containing protein [Corynebacterium glyciniphilum]
MTGPVTTVDILGPAHGGAGVARVDGQVVFVRGALPGEKGVPVHIDDGKAGKRFLTATVTDARAIGEASPHRVPALCPAAAAGAGCCDLDFVDQEGSLAVKRRVVAEQFQRIGGIDLNTASDGKAPECVSADPFTGYRTRVRLGVDSDGRAGLRRRSSSGVIPLNGPDSLAVQCAQWAPDLAEELSTELAAHSLTPGAEVCVALGDDGARSIVEVPPLPRPQRSRQRGRARGRRHDTVQRRVLSGTGDVVRTVGGRSWHVPAEAFWQAHRAAAGMYSGWVTAHTPVDSELAWDLYGGAGVFAAALCDAAPGVAVDCVDIASPATAAGRDTLADRDVRFVTGDVAGRVDTLRGAAPGATPPSVVVLDPPRTGAGRNVIETVATRGPATVLHIGCDPATAARDAAVFAEHGYRPDSVTVVDAFGLTHHVEVLVRYVR